MNDELDNIKDLIPPEDESEGDASSLDAPKHKLIKSRNAWKKRASELSIECRKMQEQIRNLNESRENWKAKAKYGKEDLNTEVESLAKKNQELQDKLQQANIQIEDLKKKI